jgi:hypothetical protein
MPAGDRTGPAGMGPMTGRGMGYCAGFGAAGYDAAGYDAPGWAGWGPGRRFYGRRGRGFRGRPGRWGGGGWGYRHWYHATGLPGWVRDQRFAGSGYPPGAAYGPPHVPPSREQELEMLKGEAEWLKEQLDAISQRMDELSEE